LRANDPSILVAYIHRPWVAGAHTGDALFKIDLKGLP
jgi:hypothetical protein